MWWAPSALRLGVSKCSNRRHHNYSTYCFEILLCGLTLATTSFYHTTTSRPTVLFTIPRCMSFR